MKIYFKKFFVAFLTLTTIFGYTGQVWAAANFDFVKQYGGTEDEIAYSVKVDPSGNIYTTGTFGGTVDFDPGVGIANLTSSGNVNAFVTKFDSSGNFVWAKHFSGASNVIPYDLYFDSLGNVYTTGSFEGTADFDPGAGTSDLTSNGSQDIYISKLDSSGNFVWAKSIGGGGQDYGKSINIDSGNNIYATGYFQQGAGPTDFDPGAGTANLTAGSLDAFILKLDSSGDFVWVKQLRGNSGEVYAESTILDSSGNIYTTGTFRYTVDFDPGAGTANLSTVPDANDIFILKLDSSGDFVFVKQIHGTATLEFATGFDINLDSSGNIYTTGKYQGTFDFDPGAGTTNLTATVNTNAFILKLDSSGDFVWVKSFDSTDEDIVGYDILIGIDDFIYVAGQFYGTADFDPGAGTSELTSLNVSQDIFILKLDSSGNFVWVNSVSGTSDDFVGGLFVDSSNNIYTVGQFYGTADFDPGAGTNNLTSSGNNDTFILKLSQLSTPTTTTTSASSITTTTAVLTGNITDTGGEANTIRGFDIGTDNTYTMSDIEDATGSYSTGSYSLTATGLTCGTTYHYRAYSTNTAGTGTGSDDTFTTSSCPVTVAASTGGAVPVWILQSMNNQQTINQNPAPAPVLPPVPTPTPQPKFQFTKNLKYRDRNNDVLELQKFLNTNGYTVSNIGAGSTGYETTYFGPATRSALIKFQKDNNIKPAVGYFGVVTRGVVNGL